MEIKSYSIVGFKDKNNMATFYKEDYTEEKSLRMFNEMVSSDNYERIVLRKDTSYDDCCIEVSSPVKVWDHLLGILNDKMNNQFANQ